MKKQVHQFNTVLPPPATPPAANETQSWDPKSPEENEWEISCVSKLTDVLGNVFDEAKVVGSKGMNLKMLDIK